MRVGLFTEGTYPVTRGGVSTWCDQLVRGLPEHEFVPVTVIADEERAMDSLPGNVTEVTLIPMWSTPRRSWRARFGGDRARLDGLLKELWRSLLPEGRHVLDEFRSVLRELTQWSGAPLDALFVRTQSTRWILAAWEAHRQAHPDRPPLTLADASAAAALVDRILALADRPWPEVDLSHVASNGAPSLLALGRWWSRGTPIVLTEHGIYLRERQIALADSSLSWASRYVVGSFLRGLTCLTYAEATTIAPVSDFNRRWELELGAYPERTRTIHNGVDVDSFPVLTGEPTVPTVSFVGRIDPLKDLEVLIEAFAVVHQRIPQARLRLFGPTPRGNEAYRIGLHRRIASLGLNNAVTWEGAVPSAMPAIEAGTVVALSSISEGLPFTVIEAMMAGRPTVSTDVGGVAEIVGTTGAAGLLVPPRDPAAMAEALLELLGDEQRRREMSDAAQRRARRLFSLDTFVEAYRDLYAQAASAQDDPADVTEPLSWWARPEEYAVVEQAEACA